MTREAVDRIQDPIQNIDETNERSFPQWDFQESLNNFPDELREKEFTPAKLREMAAYAEPPSGNEIDTGVRILWLTWYYRNRDEAKYALYKGLQEQHSKGKEDIFDSYRANRTDVAGELTTIVPVSGNTQGVNFTDNNALPNTSEVIGNIDAKKTEELYQLIGHLSKGGRLVPKGFGALTEQSKNEILDHLVLLRKTDEDMYFKFILLIAETNHTYRDSDKNKKIENKNFESLVSTLDVRVQKEIADMGLDLDHNDLVGNLKKYKEEQNDDKKKLILDFIQRNHTSETDRKTISQHISKKEVAELAEYKTTTEYKILNELPIIDHHTVTDILKKSPSEIIDAIENPSDTYLGKKAGGLAILAAVALAFGGSIKKFGLFKGLLAGAALSLLGNAAYFSYKQMNPGEGDLQGMFGGFMDDFYHARNESDGNVNKDLFKENKAFILNADIGNGSIIGEEAIGEILKQTHLSDNFNKTYISDIEDYVNNGGTNIRDIFGNEIPVDSNGNEYSDEKMKTFLSILLQRKETTDNKGADLLIVSRITSAPPGANGDKPLFASVVAAPGADGIESIIPDDIQTPGADGIESIIPDDIQTPGADGTESIVPNDIQTPGADGIESLLAPDRTTLLAYSQDGYNWIIGPDGTPQLSTYQQLSESFKDTIEDYQETGARIDNLFLLLSGVIKKDSEKQVLEDELGKAVQQVDLSDVNKVQANIDGLNLVIVDIFERTGITGVNLDNKVEVYRFIHDELDDWSIVQREIVNEKFGEATKVTPEDLKLFKENTSIPDSIAQILGDEAHDVQEEIANKELEAQNYWRQFRGDIIKEYPEVDAEILKNSIIDGFVGQYSEVKIMSTYFEKNRDELNDNGVLEIFDDIQGYGWFDLKSSNATWWKEEGFKTIAKEIGIALAALGAGVVTAGAGTAGVYGGLRALRGAAAVHKLANAGRLSGKAGTAILRAGAHVDEVGKMANSAFYGAGLASTGRATFGTLTQMARNGVIGGSTFQGGYVLARNMLEEQNIPLTEGLGQSMMMMGAFSGVQRVFQGVNSIIVKGSGEIALGAGVFTALGYVNDGVLLSPGEWTADTFYQALLMSAGFKAMGGVGKVIFKRNGNKVEMHSATPKEVVSTPRTLKSNYEKGLSSLKKEGDTFTTGNYKVTLKNKEYSVSYNGIDSRVFPKKSGAVEYLGKKANLTELAKGALQVKNDKLKVFHNNVLKIDGEDFRIQSSGNPLTLQKKLSDGSFKKIELEKLTPNGREQLINHIMGKNAWGKLERNNIEMQGKKMGDIMTMDIWNKISDNLRKKGVPEITRQNIISGIWNKTLGDTLKRAKVDISQPGLSKLWVLRNIFTGKNTTKMWNDGDKFNMLPTAWIPSWKNFGAVTALSATKFGVQHMNGEAGRSSEEALLDFAQASILGPIGIIALEHEVFIEAAKHGFDLKKDNVDQG